MTNQNQPSEVKEGGALEAAVAFVELCCSMNEKCGLPTCTIHTDKLRTVLDALAARPPSMERGEAVEALRLIKARTYSSDRGQELKAESVAAIYDIATLALAAAPSPAPSADPDEIKAAYQQGWSDREADIIERAERILPAPSAVEMAGVDRVALARAMFDAANDDLGNILVLGCGEHNYSDPEDAAWATALLMADSAILALATASREKGAQS